MCKKTVGTAGVIASGCRKKARTKPNAGNKFIVDEKASGEINNPALEQPKSLSQRRSQAV